MQRRCPSCGGPLPQAFGPSVACTYCGAVVDVAAAAQPPVQPLPMVMPAPVIHVADPADPERLRRIIWIVVIATVAPLLIGVVVTVIALAGTCAAVGVAASSAPSFAPMTGLPGGWDGSVPLVCGGSQQVTAMGVHAAFPAGTAVTASGNCQVTLVQSTLSAPMAIVASGNAQVIIQGGSVQGTVFAVSASGNSQVVSQGAQIVGPVNRSGNAQVLGL